MAAKEFAQALILTSPEEKGQKVRDAQYLLAGHNRFPGLATYKDGVIDGDYGPLTAQAVKRAKFWLGYPIGACTPVFGQTIYEYLRQDHWRPLPDSYRKAREARLAAAAQTPGQSALDYGKAHWIGYHEELDSNGRPTTNRTVFGVWYGFNGVAWCAIFDSYCLAHSGYVDKNGKPKFKYASVQMIHDDALYHRNNIYIVRTPQAGDLALYRHNGVTYAHVGFFDHWKDAGHTKFVDLSGNTSAADFSNGGYVEPHDRDLSSVVAFVRVGVPLG